jgi:hypothetical protein
MPRPKGSKNRATILREAEVSMVDIIERRGKEAFLDIVRDGRRDAALFFEGNAGKAEPHEG